MKNYLFISFFASILISYNSYSQDGKAIFKKNCAVCHSIGKGKLVGPDLKGTDKKYDTEWLTKWITSSQTMVKSNDAKAVQIFNESNHLIMPDQALSDDEIITLLAFIGVETAKLSQPAVAHSPKQVLTKTSPSQSRAEDSAGVPSKTIIYSLIALIAFLIVIIIVLSKVIRDITGTYKNDLNQKLNQEYK